MHHMPALACSLVLLLVSCATIGAQEHEDENQQFQGKKWAVLVAGSNGYDNYRHQADICHAYQVIKSHGVPEEQIIVMMYDDIAYSKENPTPGVIINHPRGKDVYKGVPKHYTGKEVNPQNFLSVLLGNETLASSGKKVLQSGPNDHVFVYFADHGAPGVLVFPKKELYAKDLIKTLKAMNERKMFKHLLFYVEACESGSMFDKKLPSDINIFAVTAANSKESSYACYWDGERNAYLGDLFSVEWIEESETRPSLDSETVDAQYRYVAKKTNQSHVCKFGDPHISQLPLGQFLGEATTGSNEAPSRIEPSADAVPSHDVPLMIAKRKAEAATDPDTKAHFTSVYNGMINARTYMKSSIQMLTKKIKSHGIVPEHSDLVRERLPITRDNCYETLYKTFDEHCFDLSDNPLALRYLYVLVNACENLESESDELTSQLAQVISSHCSAFGHKDQLLFRSIR